MRLVRGISLFVISLFFKVLKITSQVTVTRLRPLFHQRGNRVACGGRMVNAPSNSVRVSIWGTNRHHLLKPPSAPHLGDFPNRVPRVFQCLAMDHRPDRHYLWRPFFYHPTRSMQMGNNQKRAAHGNNRRHPSPSPRPFARLPNRRASRPLSLVIAFQTIDMLSICMAYYFIITLTI